MVSFNIQMGMEAERCGREVSQEVGAAKQEQFSEELSSPLVSKVMGKFFQRTPDKGK